MTDPTARVPKAYRNRLHRLKNAYRRAYRREPDLEPAVTERGAIEAIAFLEDALGRAGVTIPEGLERKKPGSKNRRRSS
jgi:hypothetical protein